MSDIDVVMDFIQAWNEKDWDAIEDAFTDDVVYHNIPMEPLRGKAAAVAAIRAMQPEEVDWQVLNIAAADGVVLSERVDNFVMRDGARVSLPVMGAMEIVDGRIRAWRDYFDLASFTSQMSA